MPNYWLGIMAVAFALALALWIGLVFLAGRRTPHRMQDSTPHRDVIGAFEAREGGRQVMPDPGEPLVPEAGRAQPKPAAQQSSSPAVPEQRADPAPEQAPARGDRP